MGGLSKAKVPEKAKKVKVDITAHHCVCLSDE
jgi:hypothetical protein